MAGFPGFMPLQFAQSPSLGDTLKSAATAAAPLAKGIAGAVNGPASPLDPGASIPGAQGPTAAGGPSGPMPLQPPTLLDAVKNMSPSQIMASLQRASTPPPNMGYPPGSAPPQPPNAMQPGSALFQQAGMFGPGSGG